MKYYATQINDKGNIAVDDTILVKSIESTAGSRILEGFKPLFSAEAVERLENKGYTVSARLTLVSLVSTLWANFPITTLRRVNSKVPRQLSLQMAVSKPLSVLI